MVPRTDEEIIADIISFCKEKKIEPADGKYKIEAEPCAEYLMRKYGKTREIIICIFCNLVRDGRISAEGVLSGKIYFVLDEQKEALK